jgi:uncharacterized protein (TIGR03083 family)
MPSPAHPDPASEPATAVPVSSVPRLTHTEWIALAQAEYARLDEVLGQVDYEQWERITDCAGWTVRDVAAHLVGAAESTARVRELVRQARAGRRLRPDALLVDRLTAVQVAERVQVPGPILCEQLRDAGARGVTARQRLPALLRRLPLPFGPPLGTRPLGYLTDRIYTRDAWMHRIDLCRATGIPLVLTPDHDGRLVADVVAEWAGTHGSPFDLTLTGPAGGRWAHGTGGPALELDAVELARVLSGRAIAAHDLLHHPVPF